MATQPTVELKLWVDLSALRIHEGSFVEITCVIVDLYQNRRSLNSSASTKVKVLLVTCFNDILLHLTSVNVCWELNVVQFIQQWLWNLYIHVSVLYIVVVFEIHSLFNLRLTLFICICCTCIYTTIAFY